MLVSCVWHGSSVGVVEGSGWSQWTSQRACGSQLAEWRALARPSRGERGEVRGRGGREGGARGVMEQGWPPTTDCDWCVCLAQHQGLKSHPCEAMLLGDLGGLGLGRPGAPGRPRPMPDVFAAKQRWRRMETDGDAAWSWPGGLAVTGYASFGGGWELLMSCNNVCMRASSAQPDTCISHHVVRS